MNASPPTQTASSVFLLKMWKLKVGEGGERLTSLNNHVGRQHWEFDADAGTPEERAEVDRVRDEFKSRRRIYPQSSDALMRMQLRKENRVENQRIPAAVKVRRTEDVTEEAVVTCLRRGVSYLSSVQAHDGHWANENAGPAYFLPPLVMSLYVTGALHDVLSSEHLREIKRYIYNHQNEDGGWGLHIEGESSTFVSVLNYVALRLIGEGPDDDGEDNAMPRARKWILDHGGAVGITSWGKFWLSVVGVYDWDGCNPLPPEFWLIPPSSPVNPGNLMCYCRLVYLPMSYLYGKRFVGKITKLVKEIREELYVQTYDQVDWNLARNSCAKEDLYFSRPLAQNMLWEFLYRVVEPMMKRWPFSVLREKAMDVAMKHIHYEDFNSRYFTVGCVEKFVCLVACWVEDPNSEAYKMHLARIPDYLWVAEDGMKVQSFGAQSWDTSLSVQALLASNLTNEYKETLHKAHKFLKSSQIRENPSGNFRQMFRHQSKGSWSFSIRDHGLQVSDVTAEALKVLLTLSQMPQVHDNDDDEGIEDTQRIYDAVNVILVLQSNNGGFPPWEPKQAYKWLENFNPTEFFVDVFIENEHVDCTSSSVQALILFNKYHPNYRKLEVESSINKARDFILRKQNPDGSWTGSWGICFTYGAWFGTEALKACGETYHNCIALQRACMFLLSKQLPDGGWGESFLSCRSKVYTNIEGNKSNIVQTSWALLALMNAGQMDIDPTPIKRGVQLLINSQVQQDGDFPQQEITGVFFSTNPIQYGGYRNIFPIWALGEYCRCLSLSRTTTSSTI